MHAATAQRHPFELVASAKCCLNGTSIHQYLPLHIVMGLTNNFFRRPMHRPSVHAQRAKGLNCSDALIGRPVAIPKTWAAVVCRR